MQSSDCDEEWWVEQAERVGSIVKGEAVGLDTLSSLADMDAVKKVRQQH